MNKNTVVVKEVDIILDAAPNPESAGYALLHHLMRRFGWAGTVLSRADVATHLQAQDIADEEWEAIQQTWSWRNAGSSWNESGATWETVANACYEAGLTEKYDNENEED